MFNILNLFTNIFAAGHSSSFLSSMFWSIVGNIAAKVVNFILQLLWTVCKFVLAVMEALEFVMHEMLGIGTSVDQYVDYASNIEVFDGTYLEVLTEIFKGSVGVSIILIVIFTIVAIVKQEWENANNAFVDKKKKGVGNNKTGIIMRMFKNILMIIALPLTMMFMMMGINSIVTSFNEALNVNTNTSVAGQVLATSTYDANKYRSYANAGQRVPIVISAYNSSSVDPDEVAKLTYEITTTNVQNKLKATATDMVESTFESFKDSITYKNNKFYNSSAYGDYYEQFVATPEQYQIMADFITYAEKSGEPFYIKSIDEPDIDWKYVSSTVYVPSDNALNITYTDATNFDESSETYTMTLAPANEVTSPISDALDSIMAMLGVGEYGDNVYKVMERDDSGDFLNLVQWANEKALIHFSSTFDIDVPSTWTDTDEIIVFEFYHFESNNTFGQNSLSDFERKLDDNGEYVGGVELDVSQIVYREYYPEADAYSPEKTIYCVLINGNYYHVEKSETLTDVYGNAYYVLKSLNGNSIVNKGVHFLDPSYTTLKTTTDEMTLKLSGGFDINKKDTWTLSDQILVYEYYSDLTVGNDLSRYGFADFYAGSGVDVKLPVYQITDMKANMNTETAVVEGYDAVTGNYVLLNGTYYNIVGSSGSYSFPTSGSGGFGPLLVEPTLAGSTYYNYEVSVLKDETVGFNESILISPEDFLAVPSSDFKVLTSTDANFEKYQNFNLQLSERFDYTDVSTWSYRDYFVFYLYSNYNVANSIEGLKYIGIQGAVGELNGGIYFQTTLQTEFSPSEIRPIYINVEQAMNISEFNISQTLDPVETLQSNDVDGHHDENLFISFDSTQNDKLLLTEIKSQKLELSDGYDYYNPSTWTVLDFILTYFSSYGYITPIDTMQATGYESFLYDVEYVDGAGKTIKDTLYRFGQRYVEAQSSRTYYLSEYNALNNLKSSDSTKSIIHSSINQFFNKSMFDFICEYNAIDSTNVVSTYDELNENLFTNFNMYVYDTPDLVEDLVADNYNEQSVMSLPLFTYKNDSFDRLDITTWTQFDWLRYYVSSGSVASGNHSTSIVYGSDNKLYALLSNNKLVNIQDGTFAMNLANNSTISASKATIPSVGTTVDAYVENNLAHLIKTSDQISSLKLYSTMKYSYTAPALPLSHNSSITETTDITDLDAIIAKYSGSGLVASKKYDFELFFDSTAGSYFIKVGDVYVVVSISGVGSHYILFNTNNTMTLNTVNNPVKKVDGLVYKSFGNTSITKTNFIDTAIYEITKDTTSVDYQVYEWISSSERYIVVEKNKKLTFVKYDDSKANYQELSSSINAVKAREIIEYLYNTYYKELYLKQVSNVELDRVSSSSTTDQDARFVSSFDVSNMKTWNPMNIILYNLGLIDESGGEITGKIYRSTTSDKVYLNITTNVDDLVENIYINITKICYESSNENVYREYSSKDSAIIEMNLRMFLVASLDGTMATNPSATESLKDYLKILSTIGSTGGYLTGVAEQDSKKIEISFTDITTTLPTAWKWIDVLYYNYYDVSRTANESKYLRYLSINGTKRETYLNLSTTSDELYLHYYNELGQAGSILTNTFTDAGVESITFSDSNFSIIGMIYNKLTGQTTGNVNKYGFKQFGTNSDKTFYYIQSAYDNRYYSVYNLDPSVSTISFKVLDTNGDYVPLATGVSAKEFLYYTPNADNVYDWKLFDFIVSYAAGDSQANTYSSSLYSYNSNKYFVVKDYYINLSALDEYVTYDISAGAVDEITTKGLTPIEHFGFGSELNETADRHKVILRHKNLHQTATEAQKMVAIDAEEITNASTGLIAEIIPFSQGFDANDFSTWTLSDFIIYYAFSSGFYTPVDPADVDFTVYTKESYVENGEVKYKDVTYTYSTINFQSFINNGGAPAYVYSLQKEDLYGSVNTYKVINLGRTIESEVSTYLDYEIFMNLYSNKMASAQVVETNRISLELSDTGLKSPNDGQFYYTVTPEEPVVDFTYKNYYFLQSNFEEFNKFLLSESIPQSLILDIADNRADIYGTINLKLPAGFDIESPNTWTLLDYIVLYEYSRGSSSLSFGDTSANANLFYNLSYEELKSADNYVSLYTSDGNNRILALNGNYYNLTSYVTEKDPGLINFVSHLVTALEGEGLTGSLASLLKNTLNSAPIEAGSFGEYLKTHLSTSKKDNELLIELKTISQNYVTSGATDEDSIDLAEYILMLSNAQIGKGLTDTLIKQYFYTYLNQYNDTLKKQSEYEVSDSCKVNNYSNGTVTVGEVVTKGSVGAYDFKVMIEEIDFAISKASHVFRTLGESADTVSYVSRTDETMRYYKSIYYNTKSAYQISLTAYPTGVISNLVREVSWPQKLMNDMQVLYPDLNWNTLIATDGWLDTLGEYTSAYTNGLYESSGNSSNTTAAGLVLSEFFLSVANRDHSGYADYEYTSLFDEDVLKSLMLSLLGEEEYRTLSLQAEVFVQLFNTSFAAVLDDIAYENAINIVDGEVDNFVMCVYKSFLATTILSSDFGEYLYTIATRVYAQYTIYESLALASGDYGNYYAYVNDMVGIDGELVEAFKYSTFYELVKYENKLSGGTPMYTFNMYNVYKFFQEENGVTDENVIKAGFDSQTSTEDGYYSLFKSLLNKLNQHYMGVYSKDGKIDDNSPIYCFMVETYWAIYYECPLDYFGNRVIPFYLNIYKDYMEGTIERWEIMDDVSIVDAPTFLANYESYVNVVEQERESIISQIKDLTTDGLFGEIFTNINKIPITNNYERGSEFGYLKHALGSTVFQDLAKISKYSARGWKNFLEKSEAGDAESWEYIQEAFGGLQNVIDEVGAIIAIGTDGNPSNTRTEKGSRKFMYDGLWESILEEFDDLFGTSTRDSYITSVYEDILEKLDELYLSMSNYIDAQKIVDKIEKASITFTLGQYGQNYVSTGYDYNIENREYTFNSYLSASRLAEYVYGGAYLEQFGVEPTYTSYEYEGAISQTKVFDSKTNSIKTKLGMWTQLRDFAGELANYTSRLYFMTNLPDVAANTMDGVKLDDYIYGEVIGSYGAGGQMIMKTTPEYLILQHLITEKGISADTFVRLIFGDTYNQLSILGLNDSNISGRINYANMLSLAKYLDGTGPSLTESEKYNAVLDYLIYIQGSDYTSGYYRDDVALEDDVNNEIDTNDDGEVDPNERIHQAFTNVISYLIVSEEQAEDETVEKSFTLDDITFKELKLLLMEKIVDYEQNPSETGAENADRYIELFNLISAQFDFCALDFEMSGITLSDSVGTQLKPIELDVYEADAAASAEQKARDGALLYIKRSSTTYVYGEFDIDDTTKNTILRLAGVANRPIEEIVNLEYDSLYDRNGRYDEALGDVFVVCTLDLETGKFIPVLARGNDAKIDDFADDTDYRKYLARYHIDISSAYYTSKVLQSDGSGGTTVCNVYPVVAKGIVSADGWPTAIKTLDGDVSYYRTDITAASSVTEDAVAATASVSSVNTVGYTDFVHSSSHEKVSGENKKTMFMGSYDLKTFVSSDVDVYYLQDETEYVLPAVDEFGGINVLDDFSSHFYMGGQTYIFIIMGFTTMFPILLNASLAAFRRVLDLIFLTLLGPLVISMNSLSTQDDDKKSMGAKAFTEWKRMVSKTLMAAFGYVIAFNVYYILSQTALQIEYVSDETMAKITRIGGLNFIKKPLLESVLRYVFVLSAASVVKSGASLMTRLVTNEQVRNPFAPAVGKGEKEVLESVKGIFEDIKKAPGKVGGLISGKTGLGALNAIGKGAKNLLPGSAMFDKMRGNAKRASAKRQAAEMSQQAQDKGVDKSKADMAAQQFAENENAMHQKEQDDKIKSANQFMSENMGGFGQKKPFENDENIPGIGESFKNGQSDGKIPGIGESFKKGQADPPKKGGKGGGKKGNAREDDDGDDEKQEKEPPKPEKPPKDDGGDD